MGTKISRLLGSGESVPADRVGVSWGGSQLVHVGKIGHSVHCSHVNSLVIESSKSYARSHQSLGLESVLRMRIQ